jgi:hypothetical protein
MNTDARIADLVHQSRMLFRHSKTIRSRSDTTPIKCGSHMLRYECLMSFQNNWENPKLSSRFAAGIGRTSTRTVFNWCGVAQQTSCVLSKDVSKFTCHHIYNFMIFTVFFFSPGRCTVVFKIFQFHVMTSNFPQRFEKISLNNPQLMSYTAPVKVD